MITFMLDTDICIYIIKKNPKQVLQKLRDTRVSDIGISSITLSELSYGVEKSSRPHQNQIALAEFLAPLQILFYDDLAAQEYGKIRSYLEHKGTLIGPMDMLIAAHALSLDCTLISNNEREFSRVPFLKIDNWT